MMKKYLKHFPTQQSEWRHSTQLQQTAKVIAITVATTPSASTTTSIMADFFIHFARFPPCHRDAAKQQTLTIHHQRQLYCK